MERKARNPGQASPDYGAQARPSIRTTFRATRSSTNESKEDPCIRGNTRPAIWFEVEDFLRYFDHFRNPSGVQRVSFEIYRAAKTLYGPSGRVRFCRLSVYNQRLHAIGFDAIRSAYLNPPGSN